MKTIILLFLLPSIIFHTQTTNEVYTELLKQNVKHPDIVLAQSILETGWYKCKDCSLDKNNLFGDKYKDYYDFLSKIGYASDPNYINKLKILIAKTL